jgi:hypothetical protein
VWTKIYFTEKYYQLMLYREIIAVCSQIHIKHINTVCGQNVELLNVQLVVYRVTTGLCKYILHVNSIRTAK